MGSVSGVKSISHSLHCDRAVERQLVSLKCALSALDLASNLLRMNNMMTPFGTRYLMLVGMPQVIRVHIIGLGDSSDIEVRKEEEPKSSTEEEVATTPKAEEAQIPVVEDSLVKQGAEQSESDLFSDITGMEENTNGLDKEY